MSDKNSTPPQIVPPPPTLQPTPMVTSLAGLGTEPFPPEAQAILREPFRNDEVEVRGHDGIVYMPTVWYRARMSRAFGPGGWAIGPRSPARMIGEEAIYEGALIVGGEIKGLAHGGCKKAPGMTQADAIEGARSDALGKCCKDIMPAVLPLWDKEWRDAWLAKYAEEYSNNGKKAWRKREKPVANLPEPPLGRMLAAFRPADAAPPAPLPTPVAADSQPEPEVKPTPKAEAAPASVVAPTGAAGSAGAAPPPSPPAAPTTTSSDTAAVEGKAELQAAAKALQQKNPQWTLEYLRGWMYQLWSVRKSDELTPVQRLAAAALLDAAGVSREAYAAKLAELRRSGAVAR